MNVKLRAQDHMESEFTALKKLHLKGRGYPDHDILKGDTKTTLFFTGLPSYTFLIAVFSLVVKSGSPVSHKLSNFQCFLLTLMKLRLNLPNYDFVFHFCVHETTISRILKSWLHLLDVRLFKLIHWTEK